ncbi:hypothetical protein N5E30_05990 [Pseudomonas chengduensis]|uniref:DUF7210 family protein n=1 Tax=Ectopseudomonas oleovorans TaxID=301 RepID=UPI00244825E2|nr:MULTISPECIES: hypothetical protein [Pseudomonas]MDH1681133.1 hypothetical protein [Pseudomonas chengduensis]MDH2197882.1 hypothetical protein [Pseudomonas oleovorans]
MSKSNSNAPAAAPTLVEVTLEKPHTHKGEPFKKGDKIRVNAAERDWLIANKVIAGSEQPQAKE